MSRSSDFDRQLTAWLDEQAPMREPEGLTYAVLARTRRTRRMPRWASPERRHPLTVITRPSLAPPLRVAWLLLIALLVAALAGGIGLVGSRLLAPPVPQSVLPAIASIPQGDEAVFAYATWIGTMSSGQTDGDIFTVRADGTDVRQLTDGPGTDAHPTWSPDGTRIAYHRWQNGTESVMVMDAGGANPMTLATNESANSYCVARWNLEWSPDGSSLIFPTRDGCNGSYDLAIVATDGTTPATKLLADETDSLYAAWSPDGTRIAFLGSEPTDNAGLYVAEVTPADALSGDLRATRITSDLGPGAADLQFGEELSAPRWSPDGTELAVAIASSGFATVDGVYIVESDGSNRRLLTEHAANPAWSPDGKQLAFHRTVDPSEYANGRPCTVRTWLIDQDGTNERQLDELGDGCGASPLWSPDGTRIASVLITPQGTGQDPLFHLGFVTVDGSSPPVILADAWGSWQPVVAALPPAPSQTDAASAGPSASPATAVVRGWPGGKAGPAGRYSWSVGALAWMHNIHGEGSAPVEMTFSILDDADRVPMRDGVLAGAALGGPYTETPVRVADLHDADERVQAWVLDVDGTSVVVTVMSSSETTAAMVAEAEAIVASIVIDTPVAGSPPRLVFTLPDGWDAG